MKHTLVINTACGDRRIAWRRNPSRSARYGRRTAILRETLSHDYGFDEVIVAGVWPRKLARDHPWCRWIHVPPQRRNRWDALWQRQRGAESSAGDTLTFCHDDHSPGPGYAGLLEAVGAPWDILIPRRVHGVTGQSMNNGQTDGYMGGHCFTMKRWIWAAEPLTAAPDEFWDVWWTPRWRAAGAVLLYANEPWHVDREATRDEA